MAEQLPPPLVTITNPARPGPLSDVIGQGDARTPHRMTPAQTGLAWLAAAILSTSAAGVLAVARLHEDDRLDRQALREVAVVLAAENEDAVVAADRVNLALLSTGPHPLVVLWARLGVPGYPTLTADSNVLRPDEPELVTFPSVTACPATLSMRFDAPILLRVRTYRGDETTLRFPTQRATGAFAAGFVFQTMERCGLYPPRFSIETGPPVSVDLAGEDLVLTLPVHNRSRATRTLSGLTASGGIELTYAGPTVVLGGGRRANLLLRLHVRDCLAALSSWALAPQQQGFTPTFRAVVGGGSLDAMVTGDGTTDTASLLSAGDELLTWWVRAVCLRGRAGPK